MKKVNFWKYSEYLLATIFIALIISACSNVAQPQLAETEQRLQDLAANMGIEGKIETQRYEDDGLTVTDSYLEVGSKVLLVTDGGIGTYDYYAFTVQEGVDASQQMQIEAYVAVDTLDAQGNVLSAMNVTEAGTGGIIGRKVQLVVAKLLLKLTVRKLGKKAKGMKCGTLWYYANRYYRKSVKEIPWKIRKQACRSVAFEVP